MHNFWKVMFAFVTASLILACGIASAPSTTTPPQQNVATIVAATMQSYAAVSNPNDVVYGNVSLIIPQGLATNALAGTVPALTDTQQWSPWDVAPGHIKILVDNYAQFSNQDAEILVYPAQEFESTSDMVKENIQRLQALENKSALLAAENMPSIPFFNAGQVFAAQMQMVSFEDGAGVRLVTQYASGIVPVNNSELFYHFQGLTNDGKYYVIAILPTSADFLPPDETKYTIDSPTVLDFPGYYKPNATGDDFKAYFKAVTDKLNTVPPQNFKPPLTTLDAFIQSITITP